MVGEFRDLVVALVSYHVVNHALHDVEEDDCKLEGGVMEVYVD